MASLHGARNIDERYESLVDHIFHDFFNNKKYSWPIPCKFFMFTTIRENDLNLWQMWYQFLQYALNLYCDPSLMFCQWPPRSFVAMAILLPVTGGALE